MALKHIRTAVDAYRELPRYRQIFNVLFKYGFRDVLKWAHLQRLVEGNPKNQTEEARQRNDALRHQPWQVRFRLMLEELGPTFVKLGQILSTRRDIVPASLVSELTKLQADVGSFPAEQARAIIEEELGKPLDEVFAKFEDKPVAAASMSQVHRATLLNGEKVAVKVQRPGIEKTVTLDLDILADLAGFVHDNIEELVSLNPRGLAEEFRKSMTRELDFTLEMRNTARFARLFTDSPHIRVPEVVEELCTQRLLVMEWFTGDRVDDREALRQRGVDLPTLSEHFVQAMFRQMFEFGFFHADPHPGNLTILPGGVIGIYDCGMMGNLRTSSREQLAGLVYGLVSKRYRLVANALLELSEEGYVDNHDRLIGDIETFSREQLDRPLGEIELGKVLNHMLDLLAYHKIRMRPEIYLGIKAITQLESTGKLLDPSLNVIALGEPFAAKVIKDRFNPKRLIEEVPEVVFSLMDMVKMLPDDLRDFYYRVKAGKFVIPMEHKLDAHGFEPMRKTLDRAAHLFAAGAVTAAILVSSAILIHAQLPPTLWEVSVPGVIFFMMGFVMFLRLTFRSWHDGGF